MMMMLLHGYAGTDTIDVRKSAAVTLLLDFNDVTEY